MSLCYQCFQEYEGEVCPYCGYDPLKGRKKYPTALAPGTVLAGRYIIGKVLGQGGFGITYIAQDYQDKRLVTIKEFYPDSLAGRSGGLEVVPFTGEREEAFLYGKECFLEEAKTLAQFISDPNIVQVYNYFEEHNTAYFAMEYLEGVSLMQYIQEQGGKISYEEAKKYFLPMMDALSKVHEKGIIHRDISPDNIFLTKDGGVKLIDFGAARYSLGDRSRSLDIILKHGYAPVEQYARHGRQGPFTDVYALAASFYYTITGKLPPDSVDRYEEDDLIPPSVLGCMIPSFAEDVLLKALSVSSNDRYRSMAEFKQALLSGESASASQPDNRAQGTVETKQGTPPSTYVPGYQAVPYYYQSQNNDTAGADTPPPGSDNAYETHQDKPKKSSRSKIRAGILIAVVAVILIGSGLAVLIAANKSPKSVSSMTTVQTENSTQAGESVSSAHDNDSSHIQSSDNNSGESASQPSSESASQPASGEKFLADYLGKTRDDLISEFGTGYQTVDMPEAGLNECLEFDSLPNVIFNISSETGLVIVVYTNNPDCYLVNGLKYNMTLSELKSLDISGTQTKEFDLEIDGTHDYQIDYDNGISVLFVWNSDYSNSTANHAAVSRSNLS